MKYFRVKKEYDNKPKLNKYYYKTRYHYKYDIWIGGELYTALELNRIEKSGIPVNMTYFEEIEIPKTKTYFFFGARFSDFTKNS